MRGVLLALLTPLLTACATAARAPLAGPAASIQRDVAWLAHPRLQGRDTGTPGSDSAAAYIARRFESLGLAGAFDGAYAQPFRAGFLHARNVGALVPGRDAALRGQVVVIGAHFDHVGRAADRALDREAGAVIRPGADDNASGTAAMLELARRFAAAPPRRSVLLLGFGAEEIGLVGSAHFVGQPPMPLDSMTAMLNLDMVGRLRGQLIVLGRWTPPLRALLDSTARATGVRTYVRQLGAADSDHWSFAQAGVPAVHFFTGIHTDYHTAGDIAVRVDAEGVARVVALAEAFVRSVADRDATVRERR